MTEPQSPPQQPWPLRARLRLGIVMASLAFAVILVPLSLFLAALGAAAGWWFGIDPGRAALQGIAFGLIALTIGWVLAVSRYIFRPDLVARTGRGQRRRTDR